MIAVGIMSTIGIPGLTPLPPIYTLTIIAYYATIVLLVNDAIKYVLISSIKTSW